MVAASEIWRALLPCGIVAYETRRFAHAPALHPEEWRAVRGAANKRVEEFAAGRACAHRALEGLGFPTSALARGADRRPAWPSGVVGSITHTDDYCGAAVGRSDVFAGIGIDAETIGELDDDTLRLVCTPEERAELAAMDPAARVEAAMILFSAKEAFFKAQSAAGGDFDDFQDVAVRLRDGVFCVEPRRAFTLASEVGAPWEGRYTARAGTVFTAIALRRGAGD